MARPRTTSDEAVLEAAARAIGRHGVAGLTLALVAREAGLAPATLLQRFGSKRGLLLAVAEQAAHTAGEPFARARRSAGPRTPALAVLSTALAALAAGVRSREEMANNLGFLQLDLADPAFHAHAVTHVRAVRTEITALLEEAVAAGELVTGTAVAALAEAVHVAYNGVLLLWAMAGDGPLADALHTGIGQVLDPHRA